MLYPWRRLGRPDLGKVFEADPVSNLLVVLSLPLMAISKLLLVLTLPNLNGGASYETYIFHGLESESEPWVLNAG